MIRPFTVAVPEAQLADLRTRLSRTSLPPDPANADWRYGTNREYLEDFLGSWQAYDWRAAEKRMNALAHFTTSIDDLPVHFVHQPCADPDAVPLLLLHGWPWTFWDFRQVVEPLAAGFHVVLPSLPGFGFSSPLPRPGIAPDEMAGCFRRLMHELGYERYGVAASDLGIRIAMSLAGGDPDGVLGLYVTSPPSAGGDPTRGTVDPLRSLLGKLQSPAASIDRTGLTDDELARIRRMEDRWISTLSHVAVQSTDPQTLAYALHDSPAGLAAWLLERRYSWSDHDGRLESAFDREALLDLVSLYWFTGTFWSSARAYWHAFRSVQAPAATRVPVGVGVFPRDIVFRPRSHASRGRNLTMWSEHPRGGHFAAAEAPDLFVDDVRSFFS